MWQLAHFWKHSPHGDSHARSLFVLLYAIFREVASFFKKKSYLCTEMSDKREYWTSMRWRCLQSKGILTREGGRKDGRWVITNKNSMSMNKREYTQANKDWLTAKAQEEGVKSYPCRNGLWQVLTARHPWGLHTRFWNWASWHCVRVRNFLSWK